MRKLLILNLVLGGALLVGPGVYAQTVGPEVLKGGYNFNLLGQAVLGPATSGNCMQTGSVAAALTGADIHFDGNGRISGTTEIGTVSIGATSCTATVIVNGTYTVEDKGNGNFEANATVNFLSENPYAPCSDLKLGSQPFNIIGKNKGDKIYITTSGADPGATYVEGVFGQSITCKAPIQNFLTSGEGLEHSKN